MGKLKNRLARREFGRCLPALAVGATASCGTDQQRITETGAGAQGGAGQVAGGDAEAGLGGMTQSGGSAASPGGAGGGATCGELTATNIEGPFFKANSPRRSDIRGTQAGRRLQLTGRVFGPDCRLISGALIDFWQANEDGAYDNEGESFRGHQLTNEQGEYHLETIVPGRYLNGAQFRPAHIHVKVSAAGHTLTTQLYFPGDPFNELDAFIDSSLIVSEGQSTQEQMVASYDFVLALA